MEIVAAIVSICKVLMFFLDLWKEKDEAKAAKKKAIAGEIVNAFAETDKKKRASKLNVAIGRIKRM